jgi:hypothetical protein
LVGSPPRNRLRLRGVMERLEGGEAGMAWPPTKFPPGRAVTALWS